MGERSGRTAAGRPPPTPSGAAISGPQFSSPLAVLPVERESTGSSGMGRASYRHLDSPHFLFTFFSGLPIWENDKSFVQQSFTRDGIPVLFCNLWGEGTALLFKDQVRVIENPEIVGRVGK